MTDTFSLAELIEEVKQVGHSARVHPNGFIQVDLAEVPENQIGHSGAPRRLHIWNPPGLTLPGRDQTEGIHDHVFDMRSTVAIGTLTQRMYRFVVGSGLPDTHEIHTAAYQTGGSRLDGTSVRGIVEEGERFDVHAGESYVQPAWTFHETDPARGLLVTVMEKETVYEGYPRILNPLGLEVNQAINRHQVLDEAELMTAVYASLSA